MTVAMSGTTYCYDELCRDGFVVRHEILIVARVAAFFNVLTTIQDPIAPCRCSLLLTDIPIGTSERQ
jgi:hypothetical protein